MMRTMAPGRKTTAVVVTLLSGLAAAVATTLPASAATVLASGTYSETHDTCHSNTAVMYGNRMPCRQGALWDRVRSGSYDETFAIRNDGAVMHTWPGHHGWSPVSNGVAINVVWVDLWSDGSRTVCTEAGSGNAWESRYNPSTRAWSAFYRGCTG